MFRFSLYFFNLILRTFAIARLIPLVFSIEWVLKSYLLYFYFLKTFVIGYKRINKVPQSDDFAVIHSYELMLNKKDSEKSWSAKFRSNSVARVFLHSRASLKPASVTLASNSPANKLVFTALSELAWFILEIFKEHDKCLLVATALEFIENGLHVTFKNL